MMHEINAEEMKNSVESRSVENSLTDQRALSHFYGDELITFNFFFFFAPS